MFTWRITKYNPINRDVNGIYLLDEWTCYSQIGTMVEGKLLTYADYWAIENAYVNTICLFMDCNNLTALLITCLEKYWELDEDPNLDPATIELFKRLKNRLKLNKNEVALAARLILRNKFWCKLGINNTMLVFLSHDYYMYIGSANKCEDTIYKIQQSGLFVEECDPEYLE